MQKFKTNVPIQHIHLDLMAYAVTNGSQGFDTIKMSSKSYLSSMLGKSGEKNVSFFFPSYWTSFIFYTYLPWTGPYTNAVGIHF